jgi:DNA-binding CsgD family transcriptional regulator
MIPSRHERANPISKTIGDALEDLLRPRQRGRRGWARGAAEYAAYLSSLNVGDEIDLVFWHDARPFACLALVRTHQQSPFSLEEFDWDGLRDFIQSTLRLHWRTRSMAVEDHLVRKLDLKSRELDIVRHILIGKDNSQIAANLGISIGTVKTHVVSILDKMGVDSRLAIACLVHDLQARLN